MSLRESHQAMLEEKSSCGDTRGRECTRSETMLRYVDISHLAQFMGGSPGLFLVGLSHSIGRLQDMIADTGKWEDVLIPDELFTLISVGNALFAVRI